MNWSTLRDEFPITRRWAFFDHAAVAPLSLKAQQAFADYALDLAENGDINERRWLDRIEHVRGLFGRLLSADPLDIAFIKNTSEGIGIVAEGYPWRRGDNVVIAAEEYPANQYPWLNLARRGVEVRAVPSRGNRLLLDDVAAAIDGRTRILSLSFVEYASGYRNDLDALGQLCRERGVLFFVDAIQGLGIFPLDVGRTPIDFLAADGHKWLLGPEGAGIFYIRRELVEKLDPIGIGWNSVVGLPQFLGHRISPEAARRPLGERQPQRRRHQRPRCEPGASVGDWHRGGQSARSGTDRLPLRAVGPEAASGGFQQPKARRKVSHRFGCPAGPGAAE